MRQSVLFVCLGNICRSPLAEAALREECKNSALNVIIDSAGTGDWHVDQPPDQRAQAVAAKNGVEIAHLRARQVNSSDFRDFDHIIALDTLRDLQSGLGTAAVIVMDKSRSLVTYHYAYA